MIRIISLIAVLLFNTNSFAADAPTEVPTEAPAKPFVYSPKPNDILLGKKDAKVTIVEYGSLTCPHCAHFFNETLPKLTEKYIDTGKVKLVYRNFLRNNADLSGATLINCSEPDRRHAFLKVLYSTQSKWAFDTNFKEAIANVGVMGGVSHEQFDACLADKTIKDSLLAVTKEAEDDYKVNSTPTFFINGKEEKNNDFEHFSKVIDDELSK